MGDALPELPDVEVYRRRLDAAEIERLATALRRVLSEAIEAGADPGRMPERFLLHQRGPDGRCPRCGAELSITRISGRSTYLCPRHQPPPGS